MSELLTIAEYSKLRGCSVSAVYKRLKSPSNRIHNFVEIQDGQTYINAEILDLEGLRGADPQLPIHEEEVYNRSNTAPGVVKEVEEKPVEEGIGAIAIRALEGQLAQKDKIIADLTQQLADAAKHEREISDKLAALAAQANELQRNNQLLIAQMEQKQIAAAAGSTAQDPEEIPVVEPKTAPEPSAPVPEKKMDPEIPERNIISRIRKLLFR